MLNKTLRPESLMMSHGHQPNQSQQSIKPPVFLTSTFVFDSAEAGKAYFETAYGLREKEENEETGMIYSRLDNPNLALLEQRLAVWEKAEAGAVFSSGMAAISTTFMEFLSPGDVLLYGSPVYGGTAHFIDEILPKYGVEALPIRPEMTKAEIKEILANENLIERLAMIYVETPANPTGDLFDIQMCAELASLYSTEEKKVYLAVDNTYMGPIWQSPLELGADLVLYSATKYIAGHSDLIAGVCLGSEELIHRIKTLRTFNGSMADPFTAWLMTRSLETLKLRMDKQTENASIIAKALSTHPMIEKVLFPGLLTEADGRQFQIYQNQCKAPGAMISLRIRGGEAEAFQFINQLKLIKLAVSLGGTESLVQHPATMTHAGMSLESKYATGITSNLVRISIGVEHPEDLLMDLKQALEFSHLPWVETARQC